MELFLRNRGNVLSKEQITDHIWGYDSAHDWDWWYKQTAYHIPHLLD